MQIIRDSCNYNDTEKNLKDRKLYYTNTILQLIQLYKYETKQCLQQKKNIQDKE